MKLQCPNVVAAAIKLAEHQKLAEGKDLWALGDALIKDCGDNPATGAPVAGRHNGNRATLERAVEELQANGITYEMRSLEDIRQVALTFKKINRVEGLSFYAHREAGNPECLEWIMRTVPKRDKKDRFGFISVVTIREKTKQYREAQERTRQLEYEKAKERETKATTLHEKREAKEEAEKLKGMPKAKVRETFKPKDSELRISANTLEIDADLERIRVELQGILPRMRMLITIHPDFVTGFIEECNNIEMATKQIRGFLTGESNVHSIKKEVKNG